MTLVTSFKDMVDSARQMTIREFCDVTGHSYETVHSVLTEELNIRKISISTWWISLLFTDDHRHKGVTAPRTFLHRYRCEGTNFLDRIVTTDETRRYFYDLETKEQSQQDLDSSYWITELIYQTLHRWMFGCSRCLISSGGLEVRSFSKESHVVHRVLTSLVYIVILILICSTSRLPDIGNAFLRRAATWKSGSLVVVWNWCYATSAMSLQLPRWGERELILVFFVRLFDLCLFDFVGFLFLLVSGKGCSLWLWRSLDFTLTFFLFIVLRRAPLTRY